MRSRFSALRTLLAACALALMLTPVSRAADFSFAGNFTRDDGLALFSFTTVGTSSLVTLRTSSYASGGFDPVLSLFRGDGLLLDVSDDGPNGLDSELAATLGSGRYFVALTQADNFAVGPFLSDGFLRTGQPFWTAQNGGPGATGPFIDGFGNQRTGAWAMTISGVSTAAPVVPEPGAATVLGFGMLTLAACARRRRA